MSESFEPIPEATRLISIVREGHELLALLNYPRRPPANSKMGASEDEPQINWGNFFEFRKFPLRNLPKSIHPLSERLLKGWDHISQARYVDLVTLDHLLTVLLHSVPGSNTSSVLLPSLELPERRKEFSPSAARPRASKGTKDRPPKISKPASIDLRTYVASRDGTQRVLKHFQTLLPQVVPVLSKKGYLPFDLINNLNTADLIPFLTLPGLHRKSMKEDLRRLPALFLQHLLSGMRLKPTKEIRELLSIFHTMNLEADDALLATVSRFVCLKENPHLLPWCKVFAQQPAERRAAFIVHVMAHHCHTEALTSTFTEGLRALNSLLTNDTYDLWMARFLEAWKRGISMEYLLAGFRLANHFYPNCQFYNIRQCTDFPVKLVEDLACYFPAKSNPNHGYRVIRLWERAGELPQFTTILRHTPWFAYAPQTAYRYAAMILDFCWYYEDDRHFHQKWKTFMEELPTIDLVIRTVPEEFQQRALDEIRGIAQQNEEIVPLRLRLKRAYSLVRRICQSPCESTIDASALNGVFLLVRSQELVTQFFQAPDSSFQALDDIARRNNVERLVSYGLHSLIKSMPDFTVRCFQSFPRHLFKTCKALGCLSYPIRLNLLKSLGDHPLFTNDLEHLPIREACQRILELCGTELWNPVPHYLKLWTRDEYQLMPKRIARYFQICFEHLDRTRLALVEQRAMAILSRGLPKVSFQGAARHAVQLIGAMDQNQRGLRRFLTAYWSGNYEYLENHTATRMWLKKHPRVDLVKWKKGVRLRGVIKGKTIKLKIEDNPLEVLKMGTYVGSCLSLGGAYSESAAAVLLDINKQVIYARDSEGKVVGRQLVAISEDDQLVCFSVYPHNVNPRLIALFWKYDIALAKALGLEIYQTSETGDENEDYVVVNILSEYWWDDGAWDMRLPVGIKKVKKKLWSLIQQ